MLATMASTSPRPRGVSEVRRRRERAPSVPTLDSAAFLGSPRDRSVSWEELRGRQPSVPPPSHTPVAAQEAVPTAVTPVARPTAPEAPPVAPPPKADEDADNKAGQREQGIEREFHDAVHRSCVI